MTSSVVLGVRWRTRQMIRLISSRGNVAGVCHSVAFAAEPAERRADVDHDERAHKSFLTMSSPRIIDLAFFIALVASSSLVDHDS
jgi:hypothetical protein